MTTITSKQKSAFSFDDEFNTNPPPQQHLFVRGGGSGPLTSYVWPQSLVVLPQQVVEDQSGVLLVRPGDQHLTDGGVVEIFIIVAIFQ